MAVKKSFKIRQKVNIVNLLGRSNAPALIRRPDSEGGLITGQHRFLNNAANITVRLKPVQK